ncbi:MAG: anthranilate phosphoribosyltransferase [Clostridium sp.]|nr:anthranilate phosphoribosyltransferase [Clostridium sp.]
MLKDNIKKLVNGEDLSEEEAYSAIDEIMGGEAKESQVGAFLMAMRIKGETVDEITGAAKAMRDKATRVKLNSKYVIDTCGTGGDGGKTFNISTAASIIAAAAGAKIAKHGNRAVSSKSGSADVLEELGVNINLDKNKAARLIDESGMAFLFAQKYHSAMKNVGPVRKQLGIRTMFNVLGPITNPAFVNGQVLGVYSEKLTNPIANVLLKLGEERAMVVFGCDGLDEITTTNLTKVSEVKDGKIIDYYIDPEKYGFKKASLTDIRGNGAKENAQIIIEILKGSKGCKRDIVILNAAAVLYVGKIAENLEEGIKIAEETIDNGLAYRKLQQFIAMSKEEQK